VLLLIAPDSKLFTSLQCTYVIVYTYYLPPWQCLLKRYPPARRNIVNTLAVRDQS
jgi:hypothetical protein